MHTGCQEQEGLKSYDLYHTKSSMESPQPEISDYLKDLEICKSQDKLKNFYEHCQNQFTDPSSESQTTYSHIQEYATNLLKEFVTDENAVIFDVGCGDGDSGKMLKKSGFHSFHGADSNTKGIQIAKDKNIYSKLYSGLLANDGRLPCKDDCYDGVISTGNIYSHLDISSAIKEFCRVVKAGGYAVFIFDDNKLDCRELMQVLGELMFTRRGEIGLMEKQYFVNNEGYQVSCYCVVVKVLSKLFM